MSERLQICNSKKDVLFLTYTISNSGFLEVCFFLVRLVSIESVVKVYENIVYF